MPAHAHFRPELFGFLRDLARNNRREWFGRNKERYEEVVKGPAQRFIVDFGPRLSRLSPNFLADPRPVGGSMFRIYRDTRFGPEKDPYKTHVGIQLRHKAGKDAHAPSFYLHLEPRGCFVAAGIWRPDSAALGRIRQSIVRKPAEWKRSRDDRRFRSRYEISGDTLIRAPRGYDPEHPLIEDLKRTDFVAVSGLTEREVVSAGFLDHFEAICRDAAPFMKYLCGAIGVPY